jgi:hypothetical protein
LQDETNFFTDLAGNNLPAVSFIKPLGPDNEHPGYTDLLQGQQHVADIVHAVQNSPEWKNTAIIITYDENGGRWDHTAPPSGDRWGPGSRVPAIIISPYAKQGFVDHTQYETDSILKTLEQVYDLKPLGTHDANANSLVNAFDLHRGHGDDYGSKHEAIDTITQAASTAQSFVDRLHPAIADMGNDRMPAANTAQSFVDRRLDGGTGFGGDTGDVSALTDTLMIQLGRSLQSWNGGLALQTTNALSNTPSSARQADTDPLAGFGQAEGEQVNDSLPNHHQRDSNKLALHTAEDDLTA